MMSPAAVCGYAVSFYCQSRTLRQVTMGVVYAIRSGVGIVLISLMRWWLFDQALSPAAWLGIGLIATGVLVLNVSA